MIATTRTEAPLELLLVGGDSDAVTIAASLVNLSAKVRFARNRQSALALLRKQSNRASPGRPALILLDIGQQGEQGWTVLREIKGDRQLMRTPVMVLGATNSREERERAYDLRANSYLPGPSDEGRSAILFERIEEFWLSKVRLPVGQALP